jgi:voltage-gated potassium channel
MFKKLFLSKQSRFLLVLLLSIVTLLTGGSVIFYILEPEKAGSLFDAFWWMVVTITTVGYGDVVPASKLGKIFGLLVIVSGFLMLSVTTALVSSILISRRLKQERGLSNVTFKKHTVLCGWNDTSAKVVKELYSENPDLDLVLINNLPEEEIAEILYMYKDSSMQFVRGDFLGEHVLDRANISNADVIIITPDLSDPMKKSGDDKTVLAAYTIRAVNSKAKIFAHVTRAESVPHLKKAQVDDYVLSDFNVGFMLGKMVSDPGVPQSVRMLFDRSDGHGISRVPLPAELFGKTFGDVIAYFRKKGLLAMGIMRDSETFTLDKVLSDDNSFLDEFIAMKFKQAGKTFRESNKTDVRLNPPDDEPVDADSYILVLK